MSVAPAPPLPQSRVEVEARRLGRFVAVEIGFTRPDLTTANHAPDLLADEGLARDEHIRSLGFRGRVSRAFVRDFDARRKMVERIRERHCEQLRIGRHVVYAIAAPRGATDSTYDLMRAEIEARRVEFDSWKASPEFAAYPADCVREIDQHYRTLLNLKGPLVADAWRTEALRLVVPLDDMRRRSTLTYEVALIPGLPFVPDELSEVARDDVQRTLSGRAETIGTQFPRRIAAQMAEKLGELVTRGDQPLTKTLQGELHTVARFADEYNFRNDPLVTRGVALLNRVIANGVAMPGSPYQGRVQRKELEGMLSRFRKQEALYAAVEADQLEEESVRAPAPSVVEQGPGAPAVAQTDQAAAPTLDLGM
jgi:hypothetical protein